MPWLPSYPAVRHYADGRQVLVASQAELDALEPGHADSPAGPFPEPPAAGWAVGALVPAPLVPAPPAPESRDQAARRLYVTGLSQRTIAKQLGVSRRTVQRWLEEDDDGRDG